MKTIKLGKLEWSDELEVGLEVIDSQHKELIHRMNHILKASVEKTESVEFAVYHLYLYIKKHHKDEEGLQIEFGYPGYLDHKFQHRIFEKRFFIMKNGIELNGTTPVDVNRITKTFANWVIMHIKNEDQKAAAFIRHAAQIKNQNHIRFNNNIRKILKTDGRA